MRTCGSFAVDGTGSGRGRGGTGLGGYGAVPWWISGYGGESQRFVRPAGVSGGFERASGGTGGSI